MQNVTKLLQSAGLAVKALTQALSPDSDIEESKATSIEEQKRQFTTATTQYFALVSSVDVGLRQQIHALEEAQITPNEAASNENADTSVGPSAGTSAAAGLPATANRSAATGGGLGNLDVGWLNSRNDSVGEEMEAELWKKASSFLAHIERRSIVDSNRDEQKVVNDR